MATSFGVRVTRGESGNGERARDGLVVTGLVLDDTPGALACPENTAEGYRAARPGAAQASSRRPEPGRRNQRSTENLFIQEDSDRRVHSELRGPGRWRHTLDV